MANNKTMRELAETGYDEAATALFGGHEERQKFQSDVAKVMVRLSLAAGPLGYRQDVLTLPVLSRKWCDSLMMLNRHCPEIVADITDLIGDKVSA